MRSIATAISLAMCLTVLVTGAPVHGQESQGSGTPPPAPPGALELAPGVRVEPLAFIEGSEVPAVYRLRLDAGSSYDFAPDPSIALALVESGEIGLTADADLTIHRAVGAAATGEPIDAGGTVTVGRGDHLLVPANASGQLRNDGSEPASILVASLTSPVSAADGTPGASPGADGAG